VSGADSYLLANDQDGIHIELSVFKSQSERISDAAIGCMNNCMSPENIERE